MKLTPEKKKTLWLYNTGDHAIEKVPQPPERENKPLVWPYWPAKLRTSSSHEEGCERDWSVLSKRAVGKNGKVVFVNTKYSCIAELSQTHSFKQVNDGSPGTTFNPSSNNDQVWFSL